MISFEMEDLIGVLQGLKPYFIVIALVLIAAIVITILVKKLAKPRKRLIRGMSWLAALLAILITANAICLGPMSALLSLVGGVKAATVVEGDLAAEAEASAPNIAREGFVLLENEGILPLKDTEKLNLFGWSSTNPVYGGAGSGGLNDLYHKVSLIESIQQAGFEVNQELIDFYTAFAENRAAVSITAQNWNLPRAAGEELHRRPHQIGYPVEVVITCTWSHELAKEWGVLMGKMSEALGSTGWYAPAMNTHRSAFTARNYEYFSEDGVLAGWMAADAVAGAMEEGVYSTIKHYAMYDCNGKMVCAWATEQSMREIYLRNR